MDKEEILALDHIKDYDIVLKELEAINVHVKPLKCHKCRQDHYMILLEELNLLEDIELTPKTSYIWNGVKVNKNSPKDLVEDFCKTHPKLCQKNNKNQ